jgi:hypothetical protein
MADYFLLHDPSLLDGRLRPALADAWRQRSFAACAPFCRDCLPLAAEYARRYHVSLDDTVLAHVAGPLPFDRLLWRTLAGELLLFTAVEIPELPLPHATLLALLAPDHAATLPPNRGSFAPVHQALYGARELTFGMVPYRPDHVGLNHREDVARLSRWLDAVEPAGWSGELLRGLPELAEEDRAEELDLAREWFAALRDLYRRCRDDGRVVVLEQVC